MLLRCIALIAVAAAGLSGDRFVGQAQTPAVTLPDIRSGTGSPSVPRLEELLTVVNSADAAAMRKYLQANSVDPRMNQGWSSMLLPIVLDLHRLSHGLDLVRLTTDDRGRTVGILRNKTTGDEQALAITVEPQAPHRIQGLPFLHPSVIATLVRPAASVARSEDAQLQEIGSYLKRLADADIFSGVVVIARE